MKYALLALFMAGCSCSRPTAYENCKDAYCQLNGDYNACKQKCFEKTSPAQSPKDTAKDG